MTTHTWLGSLVVAGAVLAGPSAALAVPQSMPVQGVLSDSSGAPIDGNQTIQFRIYDAATGGAVVHDEQQTVSVVDGSFTAYLGDQVALDLSVFAGSDRWLGIKVGSDAEMTPRLKLATVPYAAYAQECASVPTGSIMFFDLDACPPGWAEFAALGGRVPVGMPSGGTRGYNGGTALADKGARTISEAPAHSHSVGALTSSSGGGHSHAVTPNVSVRSGGAHTPTMPSGGAHDHTLRIRGGGGAAGTFGDYAQGAGSGGTNYDSDLPILFARSDHSHTMNSVGTHSHSLNIGNSSVAPAPGHTHAVPAHTTGATGATNVDVTMPYVQLMVCRKN